MNTGELLLRAVLCDPGDDTARLAFADWLDENGDERRAGFVRDCVANWPVIHDLRDELHSLRPAGMTVSGFGKQDDGDGERPCWRFGVPGGIGESVSLVFDRGFVDEVRLPAAAFTEDFARELFARHPVTRVVLTDREPQQWLPEIRGLPPGCANRWFWNVRGPDPSVPGYPHYVPRGVQWSAVWLRAKWYCDTPTYDTADAANAALSDACVAWGRSLAGLPPLPHASGGA